MKKTLAARLREHAERLAGVKTTNLEDKKTVDTAVADLRNMASDINDDGTLKKLRSIKLEVDDEFGQHAHYLRLATTVDENLEVRTFWWDQLGQYITVIARPDQASFTIKRQTPSARSAAVNHLEIAGMVRDGTIAHEDARTARYYGDVDGYPPPHSYAN